MGLGDSEGDGDVDVDDLAAFRFALRLRRFGSRPAREPSSRCRRQVDPGQLSR